MLDGGFLMRRPCFSSVNNLFSFVSVVVKEGLPTHSFRKFFRFLLQSLLYSFPYGIGIFFMRITKVDEVHIKYMLLL